MNTEYISKCGRYKLEIVQDDYSKSPNEWGNEDMFLVYSHRQFTVQRDGFDPIDIFDHLYEKEQLDTFLKDKDVNNLSEAEEETYEEFKVALNDYFDYSSFYYIFPVAAYIHSGVSLSLTDSFKKQRFDTSVTGFVLIKKAGLEPDHESSLTWDPEKLAEEYAENLIDTCNTYLIGDVYGFKLLKKELIYSIKEEDFNEIALWKGISFNDTPVVIIRDFKNKSTKQIEWEEIDSCWGFYGDDIKTNGILDHIDDNIEFEL